MNSGYPRRLAAWLGLIAIWLIVAAPFVSRVISFSQELVVPVCSAEAGVHGAVALHVRTDGRHNGPTSPLDACSYCSLFAHSTATPLVPSVAPAVLLAALVALIVPAGNQFRPPAIFPPGHPRDPPRRF
jgi:hypothetical protein